MPEDAILVADDLAPTRFLEIDWVRSAGIALTAGSASSHVAMLARSRGVPMVIGLGDIPAGDGTLALLDGERGEIEIAPSAARVAEWRRETARLAERSADEARLASAPAVTRSGRRLSILVNIQGLSDLSPDAVHADGVGLVRTEILFEPARAPPDDTTQYETYRRILAWGGARPVTIRTLDAGGTNRSLASRSTVRRTLFSACGDCDCRFAGQSCSGPSCARFAEPAREEISR